MLRENIALFRKVNFLLDVLLTVGAFLAACALYKVIGGRSPYTVLPDSITYQYIILILLIWSCLIYFQGERYAYRLKTAGEIARQTLSLVLYGAGLLLALSYILHLPSIPRLRFGLFVGIDLVALFALRLILLKTLHFIRKQGYNAQKALVVGTREKIKQVIDNITDNRQLGLNITGIVGIREFPKLYRYRDIPLIGNVNNLPEIIKSNHLDYVIVSVPSNLVNEIENVIIVCEQAGIRVCLQTDFIDLVPVRRKSIEFAGKPAVLYSRELESRHGLTIKNLVDRVIALAGLTIALPLMLTVAVAVKLTSKGPVFFRQVRCGLNGRRFNLCKFRTMCDNAEKLRESLLGKNEMDGPVFKIKNDPRITRVGRMLRMLSIDELPQLINVVKGEMSLVGPRPPLPDEVKQYDLWQRRKLSMKPGITCLWQVGDRNDTSFDQWMKLDLDYIDNWSLWLDAKILARTIPSVINATGR